MEQILDVVALATMFLAIGSLEQKLLGFIILLVMYSITGSFAFAITKRVYVVIAVFLALSMPVAWGLNFFAYWGEGYMPQFHMIR